MAVLTLFRIATGDNWNGIMKDTLRDDCDASDDCHSNCCVSPIMAPIFFVVFVLISQFVLVNVVVAVLMKHLDESNKKDAEPISEETDKYGITTGTCTEDDSELRDGNHTDTEVSYQITVVRRTTHL